MASIDSIGQTTTDPTAATSSTSTSTSASSAASSAANSQENEFLQLLVAQLQDQNPLDPMDGTQFVSQLAQFSSLQELTGMHTDLDNIQSYLQPANTGTTTDTSTSSSSGSNDTTSNSSNPVQSA